MHALPAAMLDSDSGEMLPCAFDGTPARDLILQVEDNDCVARLVTLLLEREGHRVLHARNGAQCGQLFAEHADEIALVLLDRRLPDTDGGTLCQRLRAVRPDLPVLFTSGRDCAGERLCPDGLTSFIAKPFLPGQLVRQVNSLIAAIA